MINVKRTIFNAIKDQFDKMRFLGENNPDFLKKILFLIVLDDIYDWSDYLDENQSIQKKLQEMRTNFILCNKIDACNFPFNQFYVNVNTPQTSETWKRVWDAPCLTIVEEVTPIIPEELHPEPFTPDPNCPMSITYFGEGEKIPADNTGAPYVDFATLTICEKMNIYINRQTGQMFFLDPETCTWKPLKGEFASEVTWNKIVDRPNIPGGIEHKITDDDQLRVLLQQAEQDEDGNWIYGDQQSDIPVTDSNPNPEENNDLNSIL